MRSSKSANPIPRRVDVSVDPRHPETYRAEFDRRLKKRRYAVLGLRAAFGLAGLLFWEWASRSLIDPFWISRPSEIAVRLREWYFTGFFFPHLWITVQEMAAGFFIGLVLAVLVGFLLGTRKAIADILDPFLMAIWSVPGIVLGPLFILYFGIGFTPKMVLVAVTVFFLIFFNTFTGIRSVDRDWINALRIMGAKEKEVFTKVILPASAIWIFSSFKNAIPYTLVAAIVGELIASQKGIGYLIEDASGVMDTTGVFAALFNLMIIGLVLNEIVERIEKRVLHWKRMEP
jgi:NitT/TauT family transport system permease protein